MGFSLTAFASIMVFYYYISEDLPKIQSLADYNPPAISTVHADDMTVIAEFYKERRKIIPLSGMPDLLKKAFVAAEDSRFYSHQGIDLISIVRAFLKNLEAGEIVQGGSTITQQVTKSFLLTPERSFMRKFKEAILAYRITKSFSKDEILYLYLNQIYLGHGAYGVEAASENYFGKSAIDLTLAECAILAGLPQAPSRYSPFRHADKAKQRQMYVLTRMIAEGYITEADAEQANKQSLDVKPRRNLFIEKMPFYTEHVRRYLEARYGPDILYTGGLKIHSAVNINMQEAAQEEIDSGLRELDKRQGYRGPVKQIRLDEIESFSTSMLKELEDQSFQPGVILTGVVTDVNNGQQVAMVRVGNFLGAISLSDMKWARKPNPEIGYQSAFVKKVGDVLKPGDVVLVKVKDAQANASNRFSFSLEQTPKVQSALLCVETGTGQVKTMVGGRDFWDSQVNRAIQSRRQPGSAFKPLIYAAAIDRGYTPATIMLDSPIEFQDDETDPVWKPRNYDRKFYGRVLFRHALEKSLNVVTVKILQDIGVDYAINYAKKMGISSPIEKNLSISLGSSGISLLDLVTAYSVFANQGELIQPVFITRIEDRNGKVLEENAIQKESVMDKRTAYIMTSLLEGVVKNGTGRRVLALNRPVAGKTGTTSNLNDAWFIG
ncbi:MAG TPA: PBP1A family penicillin-binding protein, partial [Desulfatirhabdiaceae bacterium]|nr:PBP1A family penicillin-binding protein [Desulfatirhabdiaceae bacterium]